MSTDARNARCFATLQSATGERPESLEELRALLRRDAARGDDSRVEWADLPSYGGEEPADTRGVWSWDGERLLVGECAEDLAIIPRPSVQQ